MLAGVPEIMRAMFDSMKHTLKGGAPVLSRTVRTNLPEGIIAEPLGALQKRFEDVDIGSYPAFRNGKPSVSLVLRGTAACAQAADRARALQDAFMSMQSDKDYLEEAVKLGLDVSPVAGSAALPLIEQLASTPRELIDQLKKLQHPDK